MVNYKQFLEKSDFYIRRSNTIPYRQISYLLSFFYIFFTYVFCKILSLFKSPPSTIDCSYARIYSHVPEMALYKSIANRQFIKQTLSGRGLDLGCGNGLSGGVLIKTMHLTELHGMDLIPHHSPLKYGYSSFTLCDLTDNLAYPKNYFDYALSTGVMEHIPDLDVALANIFNSLKSGACLCMTLPNENWIYGIAKSRILTAMRMNALAKKARESRRIWSTHFHYWDKMTCLHKLTRIGFVDIKITPIFHRDALLAYDLLNMGNYLIQFFVPDRLKKILAWSPVLKKIMEQSTTGLCAYYAEKKITPKTSTLNFIVCRKP